MESVEKNLNYSRLIAQKRISKTAPSETVGGAITSRCSPIP